jgi:hypothetical protein
MKYWFPPHIGPRLALHSQWILDVCSVKKTSKTLSKSSYMTLSEWRCFSITQCNDRGLIW